MFLMALCAYSDGLHPTWVDLRWPSTECGASCPRTAGAGRSRLWPADRWDTEVRTLPMCGRAVVKRSHSKRIQRAVYTATLLKSGLPTCFLIVTAFSCMCTLFSRSDCHMQMQHNIRWRHVVQPRTICRKLHTMLLTLFCRCN